MQKLKDNWVILAAVTVVVAIVTVVIINHTKFTKAEGSNDFTGKVDFKA